MRSSLALVLALVAAVALARPALAAAPPEDRILSADQYTTDKARSLAKEHGDRLRELNADLYNCLPWVEVQKQSIGFFKPKHVHQDDRYMSVRIYIEQDPSPEFDRLPVEQRASAMFSRYAGALLHRMAKPDVVADPMVDGFTVILEWQKQVAKAVMARPIHETIAAFFEKPTVVDYLGGKIKAADLASRAVVLGFDGETALGRLHLAAWDDNFVSTYKVKNYVLDPGVTCH